MDAVETELEEQLRASLKGSQKKGHQKAGHISIKACGRRRAGGAKANGRGTDSDPNEAIRKDAPNNGSPGTTSRRANQMTLRHKLGEVRRRIGYIQKRGYNERHNYNYVVAADIAGTIGDILAELGVVVIPRLESITYEPQAPGRGNSVRVARVIMAYTFTDEDSGEE